MLNVCSPNCIVPHHHFPIIAKKHNDTELKCPYSMDKDFIVFGMCLQCIQLHCLSVHTLSGAHLQTPDVDPSLWPGLST